MKKIPVKEEGTQDPEIDELTRLKRRYANL
jgi:hypothetical protein